MLAPGRGPVKHTLGRSASRTRRREAAARRRRPCGRGHGPSAFCRRAGSRGTGRSSRTGRTPAATRSSRSGRRIPRYPWTARPR